ncbi:phosphoribosylanthranilate isomerase [Alcaligenes parafaecalis]|uniref:N-(5'-phosphoribosyl)anthranilate isomerase n=1 Tax=Alcaligenes parafaecalis TaxID=171260 RepID=A0ABT3VJT1_9BURK|nr:phosphoribosylanthranilate isomerase [Alcaligenes parafaecalis]MCX5463460.1 phosphoribosylanthranilate isomerase [Alcaligenes parafaecalis]
MFSRTRVKICGFTRAQDIDAAVQLGADAVGFVFYPKSARMLSTEQAAALRARVPAFVQAVSLFVNASPEFVQEILEQVQPDLLQFHGEESPEECRQYAHPYIKAFRVGAPGLDTVEGLLEHCLKYRDARAWLMDGYHDAYGGTGTAFDPELIQGLQARLEGQDGLPPLVLAGGMRIDNVAERVALHRPYAIDVSSGVELEPGIKCHTKMGQFMQVLSSVSLS